MQKLLVISLACYLVCIVNGCSRYCSPLKNKIYQCTVKVPDKEPFYALMDFRDQCKISEYDSIGHGGSIPELGIDLSLDTHIGFYACHSRTNVHATISGYVYPSPTVPVLADNGAIAVHDYKFRFSKDLRTCHGSLEYAFYETGSDPFDSSNKPVLSATGVKVNCQLLNYQAAQHKY